MKLFKLMLFYTLSAFQVTVMASGNGGPYGGAGTEVNVIQTSESQMLSKTQIEAAILTCGGNGSENNIFKKVLGPLYQSTSKSSKKNSRNLEISNKITEVVEINENSLYWAIAAKILDTSESKDPEKGVLVFRIFSGNLQTDERIYGGEKKGCLAYPTDRCVANRSFIASNLPIIKFQEVHDKPTVDPITGEILKTELHFKGVTVEYDDSLSPESILYHASSKEASLLRFPAKELAECLRARLSNL